MPETTEKQSVVTGKCRLAFPHLYTPRKDVKTGKVSDPPVYDCTLIAEKDDPSLPKLKAMALKALKKRFGEDAEFNDPPDNPEYKSPFRKDSTYKLKKNPEFAGKIMLPARSKNIKVVPVYTNMKPIEDPSLVYPGCYVKVALTCYAYDRDGGKGVAFGLSNVVKVADGESLGASRRKPEDDFDGEDFSEYDTDNSETLNEGQEDEDDY